MLLLLITLIQCKFPIIMSIFNQSDCLGPPLAMTRFQISQIQKTKPAQDTWPRIFEFLSSEWAIGLADSKLGISTRETCATSLEIQKSVYHSASYGLFTGDFIDHVPSTGTGNYCKLEPIYGYEELFVRVGVCFERVKCEDGIVSIFALDGCLGTAISSPITSSTRELANTTISQVQLIGQPQGYKWLQYVPRFKATVTFRYAADFIMLIAVIIANVLVFATVVFYGLRYYQKQSLSSRGYLFSQFFWFLFVVTDAIVSFGSFPNRYENALWWELYYIFRGIASIATVCHTANLLLMIYSNSKVTVFMSYLLIALIHIGLGFGSYLTYFDRTMNNPSFSAIYYPWHDLSFYWLLFMLVFDLTPSVAFIYKAIKMNAKTSVWQTLWHLITHDWIFTTLVVSNLLTISVFGGMKFVDIYFNYVWGSDRMGKAMSGIRNMCIAIHGITQCIAISHLSTLLNVVKSHNSLEMSKSVKIPKNIQEKATMAETRVL